MHGPEQFLRRASVVRHGSRLPLLQQQAGLRVVQSLVLLVDPQLQGVLRRVHVEPHHIPRLLHEPFVSTEPERFDLEGFQPIGPSDALHGHRANALDYGHRPHVPGRDYGRVAVQHCRRQVPTYF